MRQIDILQRRDRRLVSASIYTNGRWRFIPLTDPFKIYNNRKFYKINNKFGLVKEGTTNPALTSITGEAGEYIAEDALGTLSLINENQYKLMFPEANLTPTMPPTSSALLSNPAYITNFVRGTPSTSYNTTVANTINLIQPTTQKPCNCN
jgi:hypothetical protein